MGLVLICWVQVYPRRLLALRGLALVGRSGADSEPARVTAQPLYLCCPEC